MRRVRGIILCILLLIITMEIAGQEQDTVIESAVSTDTSITDLQFYKVEPTGWYDEEQEEIRNEIFYGELEEVALVVQAEAGNQDELGKRYVADVIFNRVDSKRFPDKIHDVLYQKNPIQFSTVYNKSIDKAGYMIDETTYQIVLEEYFNRTNSDIIYFRTGRYSDSGVPAFKHGDHYFSTLK